jgi:hypothetical protein
MSHFFIGVRFLAHNISCGFANVFVCICEFFLGQTACNLGELICCVFLANPSSQLLCMCCVFLCSYQYELGAFKLLLLQLCFPHQGDYVVNPCHCDFLINMVLRGIESSTLALLLAILYFAIGEPFCLFFWYFRVLS